MKIWIYLNGLQQGPYTLDQLRLLSLDPSTPVWYDGLPQWQPAHLAPLTAGLFAADNAAGDPSRQGFVPGLRAPAARPRRLRLRPTGLGIQSDAAAPRHVHGVVHYPHHPVLLALRPGRHRHGRHQLVALQFRRLCRRQVDVHRHRVAHHNIHHLGPDRHASGAVHMLCMTRQL